MQNSIRPVLLVCSLYLAVIARAQDQPPPKPPFPAPRPWKEFDGRCEVTRVSTDGKLVAVVTCKRGKSDGNMVIVYDTPTGKERYRFPALYSPSAAYGSVAFTPDGKRIISVTAGTEFGRRDDLYARVGDAADGKLIRSIPLRAGQYMYQHARYALSDKLLVVTGTKETATFYDLATGKDLGDLPGELRLKLVSLSRDGRWLVGLTEGESQIHLWDVEKRSHVRMIYQTRATLRAVDISPDGTTVAYCNDKLRVFDRATGAEKANCDPMLATSQLRFTVDGKTLVAAGIGPNYGIAFWDWQTSKEIRGGCPKGAEMVFNLLPRRGQAERNAWRWGELWDFGMSGDGKTLAFPSDVGKLSLLELDPPKPPGKK